MRSRQVDFVLTGRALMAALHRRDLRPLRTEKKSVRSATRR
jgi:hypothetical protein